MKKGEKARVRKEKKGRRRKRGKTIDVPNPWHKDCGSGNVASLQELSSSCVQTDLELSHTLFPLHTKVITEPQWTVLGSVCREHLQGRREGVEGGREWREGGREGHGGWYIKRKES